MAKIIHGMIRVRDLDRSLDFYRQALGLQVADRFDFDTFTLAYLRNDESDFELELTVNKGRTEPYDLGSGFGHLAVSVEDLDAEHARLAQAELAPGEIKQLFHDGAPLGRYFFLTDPDGYRIEVLAQAGRFAEVTR